MLYCKNDHWRNGDGQEQTQILPQCRQRRGSAKCAAIERGTARSGKGGKGGKVKSRKQAIAIALSEARKEGKRVPKKK